MVWDGIELLTCMLVLSVHVAVRGCESLCLDVRGCNVLCLVVRGCVWGVRCTV